ncbi:IS66 family insertion sequence element accessory protein TnpB, partial [Turicibacter sp. T129]
MVCGHTDMRCGIDGLAGIITNKYNLDLFNDALFLFCGRKKDRFKALYWDKDGFILLYKR